MAMSFEFDCREIPAGLDELGDGERYLLRSLRRWLKGCCENRATCWSEVWNLFARDFGTDDGGTAVAAINRMIGTIADGARGRLTYHQPCCGQVTTAELVMVGLVGACQAGEARLAHGLCRGLVRDDAIGDLLDGAASLAAVLARHGRTVPARHPLQRLSAEALDQRPLDRPPTIH